MEALLHELVAVGDPVYFVFKRHVIHGVIGAGGQILQTVIESPEGVQDYVLYTHVYASLTAWSESALCEGLGEESTRYASWKRVIHAPSGKTLQALRSELNVNLKGVVASRQDLYAELNRYRLMSKVELPARPSAAAADVLLMSPSGIASFEKWAASSSLF